VESKKSLLLLVDGNALVHRAFHALPPLTVPRTGESIGAVYGFAMMLGQGPGSYFNLLLFNLSCSDYDFRLLRQVKELAMTEMDNAEPRMIE
jgi:hypothetical protein